MNAQLKFRRPLNLPAIVVVAVIFCVTLFLTIHLRTRHRTLDAEWRALQTQALETVLVARGQSAGADAALARLQAEIGRERAARIAAEKRAADVAAKLPKLDGEVVVSFGRIEEMGREAARALLGAPDTAALLAQAPEYRRFEETPAEIARFQAALLKEYAGLDANAAQRLSGALENEFAILKARGLNASQRPQTDSAQWDAARTNYLRGMAERLSPFLPPNVARDIPLEELLNLGLGVGVDATPDDAASAPHKRPPQAPAREL